MTDIIKIAGVNVFILILAIKWKITEFYQLRRPRWLPDKCNFCLFFWLSMIIHMIIKRPQTHPVYEGVTWCFDVMCTTVFSLLIFKFFYERRDDR